MSDLDPCLLLLTVLERIPALKDIGGRGVLSNRQASAPIKVSNCPTSAEGAEFGAETGEREDPQHDILQTAVKLRRTGRQKEVRVGAATPSPQEPASASSAPAAVRTWLRP
ncbi:hypothetical protein OJAV_G00154230 [Oryzias javanicus]|uniref:Uncharacterized protein n=1 Tax=Oryzias javanicus TaxID=123683 RepID=A0A3S2U3T5_ORYJA|nr:hypothetical protein OJAV_G00154230 [Oryzias javanicus]